MTTTEPFPLSSLAPTTPKRRPQWTYAIAAALVVVLLAAGAWWWTTRDITVEGEVRLRDDHFASVSGLCAGEGGYDDLHEGAQVVISDAGGATLALGRLSWGRWGQRSNECIFPFTVDGVPGGHDFYGIKIADRNVLVVTRSDMDSPRVLTIGN